MKFSIFTAEKPLCILHGLVFIMLLLTEQFVQNAFNQYCIMQSMCICLEHCLMQSYLPGSVNPEDDAAY